MTKGMRNHELTNDGLTWTPPKSLHTETVPQLQASFAHVPSVFVVMLLVALSKGKRISFACLVVTLLFGAARCRYMRPGYSGRLRPRS